MKELMMGLAVLIFIVIVILATLDMWSLSDRTPSERGDR